MLQAIRQAGGGRWIAGWMSVSMAPMDGCASKACERVQDSVLEELVITDSISYKCPKSITKVRQVTVGTLFGEAIRRVSNEESVSSLFG